MKRRAGGGKTTLALPGGKWHDAWPIPGNLGNLGPIDCSIIGDYKRDAKLLRKELLLVESRALGV